MLATSKLQRCAAAAVCMSEIVASQYAARHEHDCPNSALDDFGVRITPLANLCPYVPKPSKLGSSLLAMRRAGDPVLAQPTVPIADTTVEGIRAALVEQAPVPAEHMNLSDDIPGVVRNREAIGRIPLLAAVEAMHRSVRQRRHDGNFTWGECRGVTANQLGFSVRMMVLHVDGVELTMLNPTITDPSTRTVTVWDSCHTCDDVVRVRRHYSVGVSFFTPEGDNETWFKLPEARSRIFQHKIDHLDGILPYDRVVPLLINAENIRDDDRRPLVRVAEEIKETNPAAPLDAIGVVPRAVFDKHRDLLLSVM